MQQVLYRNLKKQEMLVKFHSFIKHNHHLMHKWDKENQNFLKELIFKLISEKLFTIDSIRCS